MSLISTNMYKNTNHTTTILLLPQRETMDSEAFYNIIDNERSINDTELLSVTVVEGAGPMMMMIAQSRTAYMRRLIPRDGFEMVELTQITEMLNVDRYELASRLVATRNQGGITLDLIRELATLYNFVILIQSTNNIQQFEFVPVPAASAVVTLPAVVVVDQAPVVVHPRLIPVVTPIAQDETCIICLQTNKEQWVTAAGCNSHRFHAGCISRWTRGTCPTCRAVLQGC